MFVTLDNKDKNSNAEDFENVFCGIFVSWDMKRFCCVNVFGIFERTHTLMFKFRSPKHISVVKNPVACGGWEAVSTKVY